MSARCLLPAVAFALLCLSGCAQPQQPIHYAEDKTVQDTDWQRGADKPPAPKTLFAMARVLVAEGRLSEALLILQRVSRQAPACLNAYVEIADIHMRQNNPASAVAVLQSGLKIAPADPVMLNDLGVAHLALHEPEKALDAFERAVTAAPRQTRYVANVALSQGLLGRYDQSLATYMQVVPAAQAHHNVAVICQTRGDGERATAEQARAVLAAAAAAHSVASQPAS